MMKPASANRWKLCWNWKATKCEIGGDRDEGLARIGERTFDLVLLDLALPDRNGIDMLAEFTVTDPQHVGHHDHRLWHAWKTR